MCFFKIKCIPLISFLCTLNNAAYLRSCRDYVVLMSTAGNWILFVYLKCLDRLLEWFLYIKTTSSKHSPEMSGILI
jgi:hypothetical protein